MAHIDYNYPLLNTNHTLNLELNLKFTASLRSNNLGMLILGSNYEPHSIQKPPKSSNFTFTSICHHDCTNVIFKYSNLLFYNIFFLICKQKFLPNSGINVFAALPYQNSADLSVVTILNRLNVEQKNVYNSETNNQTLFTFEPLKIEQVCFFQSNEQVMKLKTS